MDITIILTRVRSWEAERFSVWGPLHMKKKNKLRRKNGGEAMPCTRRPSLRARPPDAGRAGGGRATEESEHAVQPYVLVSPRGGSPRVERRERTSWG